MQPMRNLQRNIWHKQRSMIKSKKVYKWSKLFKESWNRIQDEVRSDRHTVARTLKMKDSVNALIFANCIVTSSLCCAARTDFPDSLTTHLYCPSLLAGLPGYILYWHRAAVDRFFAPPREYIAYEFILTSPAVSWMSGSCNLDGFHDGWLVAAHLLFCGV